MKQRLITFSLAFLLLAGTNLFAQKKSTFGSILKKGVETVSGKEKKDQPETKAESVTPQKVEGKAESTVSTALRPRLTPQTKVVKLNNYVLDHRYSNGLLCVMNVATNQYGFLDTEGNLKIGFAWGVNAIGDPRFDNEVCTVHRMDKTSNKVRWYIIDRTGKETILPVTFSKVSDFVDGRAVVLDVVAMKSSIYFIDKMGKKLFPALARSPKFVSITPEKPRPFSEELAAFYDAVAEKWGYIDRTGKLIIAPAYAKVGEFNEGLAAVQLATGNGAQGKWGFIDKTGKMVIEPKFTNRPSDFSEGLAIVLKPNDLYCAVDKSGTVVGNEYAKMSPFYQGYAFVQGSQGVMVIDKTFTELRKIPKFSFPTQKEGYLGVKFVNGLASVGAALPYDEVEGRIVNPQGETIIEQEGTNAKIGNFFDGLAYCSARIDKKYYYGFINTKGEYVYYIEKEDF